MIVVPLNTVTLEFQQPSELLNMNDAPRGTSYVPAPRRGGTPPTGPRCSTSGRPRPWRVARRAHAPRRRPPAPGPHNFAPTLKHVVDGLVGAGIWPDDTPGGSEPSSRRSTSAVTASCASPSHRGANHDRPSRGRSSRLSACGQLRCPMCKGWHLTKGPFTIDHLLAHLQIEADFVVDRAVVTRGQRLVLRDLLQQAHDEIERLQDENEALRIDLTQGATEAFAGDDAARAAGLLPHGRHGRTER